MCEAYDEKYIFFNENQDENEKKKHEEN